MYIRRLRPSRALHHPPAPGQGIVEFALASTVFLVLVLGTIDVGRAIFLAAELHNAVREGAAVGRLRPTDTAAITAAVVAHASGNGLTANAVAVECAGGCATGGTLTVRASAEFQAVAQSLFGIPPFTIDSAATVDIE